MTLVGTGDIGQIGRLRNDVLQELKATKESSFGKMKLFSRLAITINTSEITTTVEAAVKAVTKSRNNISEISSINSQYVSIKTDKTIDAIRSTEFDVKINIYIY